MWIWYRITNTLTAYGSSAAIATRLLPARIGIGIRLSSMNLRMRHLLVGHSLQRLEENQGLLDWQRQLSERDDVQLAGSWDHVDYGANAVSVLDNYDYGQVSAQYDRTLTERWQWSSVAGVGRYEVIGQGYRSDEDFVQTSLKRALAEQWSLTAQIGYAYLKSQERILEGSSRWDPAGFEIIQAQASGSRGSPNYAATLERRYERVTLDLSASRAIQPSGLGALFDSGRCLS